MRMEEHVSVVKELERQSKLINEFSAKAELLSTKKSRVEELADLVVKATSDSGLLSFSKFLSLPTFTRLSGTLYASSLDLLRLFAYGTWHDYTSYHYTFASLVPMQVLKLKQLTLITLAQSTKVFTYNQLEKELSFSNSEDLVCFLDTCISSGIIKGKLNQQLRRFEVLYMLDASLRFHDESVAGQSFDTFLQEATAVRRDEKTGLLSNDIVKQVEVPTDNTKSSFKAEFEIKGSRLFSMLTQHVTNTHAAGKSFDGLIYLGMFTVHGDQLFLRPTAVARICLTSDNSLKDHKAVAYLLRKYTGLDIVHTDRDGKERKILYPLYMSDLLAHLEGQITNLHPIHSVCPISKVTDANFITFLVCHATYLTTAERALLFWYARTYHKSSSSQDQSSFEHAMNQILCNTKWFTVLKNHWLFKEVFNNLTYNDKSVDCFRLMRDWEAHAPEYLKELERIKYTAAVLNYLVEHHFGDFLPQAMYHMLCTYSKLDNKFDLKDWIERLHNVSKDDTTLLMMDWARLNLQGLLPSNISSSGNEMRIFKCDMEKLQHNGGDTNTTYHCSLSKWRILNRLHVKSEPLYYKPVLIFPMPFTYRASFFNLFSGLIENIEEYAPIVYTPTVGLVCKKSSGTFRKPWGMYFSAEDQGKMMSMANNFPVDHIDIIVVTDGSRALGLDDLGVKGIGVAAGKTDLYVAAAGINPRRILPVMVDVGTDSTELLKDSLYHGRREHRLDGQEYLAVLDEVMLAVSSRWPNAIVQFEDFERKWACTLLERYRKRYCVFNDDRQGAAAVTIAGLLAAMRTQGRPLSDFQKQRIVIANFGRDGAGVLNCMSSLLLKMLGNSEGSLMGNDVGKSQIWVVDADGLITEERLNIGSALQPFSRKNGELVSHDLKEGATLIEVIKKVKPDVLLGLSAVGGGGGKFSNEVLEALKNLSSSRPAIFAMSHPAECTARDAFSVLGKNIIYASRSTFDDVDFGNGKFGHYNSGDTIYIFPGVVLGAFLSGARLISDEMFLAAAQCFALHLKEDEVMKGIIYPPISRIRDITKVVAAAVVVKALSEGLATGCYLMDADKLAKLSAEDIADYVGKNMWSPH